MKKNIWIMPVMVLGLFSFAGAQNQILLGGSGNTTIAEIGTKNGKLWIKVAGISGSAINDEGFYFNESQYADNSYPTKAMQAMLINAQTYSQKANVYVMSPAGVDHPDARISIMLFKTDAAQTDGIQRLVSIGIWEGILWAKINIESSIGGGWEGGYVIDEGIYNAGSEKYKSCAAFLIHALNDQNIVNFSINSATNRITKISFKTN